MSAPSSQAQPTPLPGPGASAPVSAEEIAASCRLPLLVMFVSAAAWLVIGSAFGLIASIKFHQPAFLADCSWLTYGRVRPAYYNCVVYGFCVQAGLGVALWLIAVLGRTELAGRWLITVGAKFWNLGVTVGILGILAGDSTGYETLEMPVYAALLLFLGYSIIGVYGLLTLHRRRYFPLFVSQWFLVAALFWFPWIYSTACLLISVFPVRGVTQAAIAWWYAANLEKVWLGAVGLAAAFYLVPKLKQRELRSHYLALFTFWGLILFAGWTGIPRSAPLPAWMPALSGSAEILMLLPLLTVGLNLYGTLGCVWTEKESPEPLRFVCVGIAAFLAAGALSVLGSIPAVGRVTELTWYSVARQHLNVYGFFVMVMFGAIYYIVPRLTGIEFASPKLIRAHLALAVAGVLLIVVPLGIGGLLQGLRLARPEVAFYDIMKGTMMFLRASTVGDLCLAAGHLLLLVNLAAMVRSFSQARVMATYSALTRETAGAGA